MDEFYAHILSKHKNTLHFSPTHTWEDLAGVHHYWFFIHILSERRRSNTLVVFSTIYFTNNFFAPSKDISIIRLSNIFCDQTIFNSSFTSYKWFWYSRFPSRWYFNHKLRRWFYKGRHSNNKKISERKFFYRNLPM